LDTISLARRAILPLALFAALPGAVSATEWTTIDKLAPVIGADGLPHTATCSGYPGTDPRYRFWVHAGDPAKLAVVFDGGGACWDKLTCSYPMGGKLRDPLLQFYTPAIPRGVDPSQYGGLLDLDNPANPVKGWTVVAIPYCTGDVHLGSVDQVYDKVGHKLFPRGPQITIHHRGYDNFMVVLDWITRNVPQGVNELLVTGASAGGYGATGHAPWLARQFPQARLSVLADASQGVSTAVFDGGTPGRGSWNLQLAPWVFGSDPLAVRSGEMMRHVAQAYPQARVAQYTTTQDSVQAGFYGYMKLAYGPGGTCPDITADWNQQMLSTLADDRALLPNFRSYVAPGTSHTIIGDNDFYAASPAGPVFADWLGAMLRGSDSWDHAACPDCLSPLPCP
jgi:hypothetical protein